MTVPPACWRVLGLCVLALTPLLAADPWIPDWEQLKRVLSFRDHNTRVVVGGVSLLGMAAGLIGVYLFLQKRALLGDALAHATVPGIAAAFMLATALGLPGKYLPGLLIGAVVFGLLGVLTVQLIDRTTRLGQDAALGIVLSSFFGLGTAMLSLIQQMDGVNAAGLEYFISGNTASMTAADAGLTGSVALVVLLVVLLLRKEFALLVFDRQQAAAQGWPVRGLDLLLMVLVVAVVVIGLQAVGAILMLALLIIPPSAARFWTDRLGVMLLLSGVFGAGSAFLGAIYSGLVPKLPAGAVIVLVAAMFFTFSLFFGRARGVVVESWRRWQLGREHDVARLLRRLIDLEEACTVALLVDAGWRPAAVRRAVAACRRRGWLLDDDAALRLSEVGQRQAEQVLRNHQLWHAFLLTHADGAARQWDGDEPSLDDSLPATVIAELEAAYLADTGCPVMPGTRGAQV